MSRALIGVLGALLATSPERVVQAYESIALENAEEATAKRYLVPTVRVEGLAYVLVAAIDGRVYDRLMDVIGVFGALALCFPRRYLETGGRLVYADGVEWRDGFVTVARALGAGAVVLSVRAYLKRSDGE